MKKIWISISQAGMGDRLVCFASSLRRDKNALIYWPIQKPHLERPFDHLFNYKGYITEYNGISRNTAVLKINFWIIN